MATFNSSSTPNFLIAAARKSSGKTTVSLGLARAYANRRHKIATFKKGPDYIDPLWLQLASGNECYNLDFNTQNSAEIISTFANYSDKANLAIIESNKGLFDGVDPLGSDSNAQLAKMLKTPIILVLDTAGITRGVAPLLRGYSTFDPHIEISGIILNNTGGIRHESKLRKAIETYSDIEVLGTIGRDSNLSIRERHLGLTTPSENASTDQLIAQLAITVEQNINLDALLEIARSNLCGPGNPILSDTLKNAEPSNEFENITIAVARDEAFGFYYPDDLKALQKCGAKLVFFSALNDSHLPETDGLFIGGGFPETHMKKLEANRDLRDQIKSAIKNGLPTYAECGGLMYLGRSIQYQGEIAKMVGVIPGDCQMHKKPQGRGYTKLQKTKNHPWPDLSDRWSKISVPAHEFHHASIDNLPRDTQFAYRVKRGHGIDGNNDGIILGNLLANFCHFRNTQQTPWVSGFTGFVRSVKKERDSSVPTLE
ncbi:MAG: hydrogenobyrinic acid a,c-diamide synthase (glutamine-hydrolyzing) [Hyphomicrobiales bacterium]|nr:hydrogenobyrinic acid a,c-diamide synthase (glutamine-hydrolyzing) [Hyphomicrobiales bacterium]